MKLKKNKSIKKEVIKLNKLNIRINIMCLILFIFYLINNLIMYFSDAYSYFFIKYISNFVNGLFYYLNSYINYLSIIILILYIVVVISHLIIEIYYENFSLKKLEARSKIVNISYTIFIILTLLIILPNYFAQFENHLPNFDELYFKNTKNKTYEVDDLIKLDNYLQKQVLSLAEKLPRDDENSLLLNNLNYNKQAIANLTNISSEIELLNGLYPVKSSKINNLMRGVLGSKVVGFTMPYSTYFDYEASATSILNTITHEFCHTKGIIRESETVYCAFLAGIRSDDKLSNYAAYIEAFSWVSEALLNIDAATADEIEDRVLSKCLTNNYKEFCEVYTKNTDDYINGANRLKISSYRLKNYKNHLTELKESLLLLSKNGAKIYVGEEEKTVNEILDLVTENSENRVNIKMDITSAKFKDIKPAIINKELYLAVYQQNKKDKVSQDKEQNPKKYYLAPLKDKDEHIFFNKSYGNVTYEYSRVARLILEHYEKEGY